MKMAFSCRTLYRNSHYIRNLTKPADNVENLAVRIIASRCISQNTITKLLEPRQSCLPVLWRQCSSKTESVSNEPPKKKGLVQQFKQMYKNYWYVVLPVHLVTSAFWLGSSYYLVRSGVDVPTLLESLGIGETLLKPLRESSAGYFALTFALYKLITPLRYAVTIGGTTYAIRKLKAIGWIKPVPSRERIKEMFQQQQDAFLESKHHYQSQIKQKHTRIMEDLRRYKNEMKSTKNKTVTKTTKPPKDKDGDH